MLIFCNIFALLLLFGLTERCLMQSIRCLVVLSLMVAVWVLPCLGYQTEQVVLVIIDGLRYTEGLGDPSHTYVPQMYALSQQGVIIEPFLNDGYTYTSRAIPAIWCGAWTEILTFSDPSCGGQQNNYSELPTVFEYFRRQLLRPQSDCVYVLKNLCSWKASFDPGYGPNYWPLYHTVGSSDLDVWHEAEDILTLDQPSFMMLYLADVDHEGHSGNWNNYTHAISVADSIVGMLWNLLQSQANYAGTTSMFVTNDHGRHTTNFSSHGDGCDGCRTIQLLAIGPDIQQGLVSTTSRTLRDVTPTIGELLGFDAEYATGVEMTEILDAAVSPVEDLTISILTSSHAVLIWSLVPEATEYNVYIGSTPTSIDSLAATVTSPTWMEPYALTNHSRFYQVTAVR